MDTAQVTDTPELTEPRTKITQAWIDMHCTPDEKMAGRFHLKHGPVLTAEVQTHLSLVEVADSWMLEITQTQPDDEPSFSVGIGFPVWFVEQIRKAQQLVYSARSDNGVTVASVGRRLISLGCVHIQPVLNRAWDNGAQPQDIHDIIDHYIRHLSGLDSLDVLKERIRNFRPGQSPDAGWFAASADLSFKIARLKDSAESDPNVNMVVVATGFLQECKNVYDEKFKEVRSQIRHLTVGICLTQLVIGFALWRISHWL